MSRSKYKYCPRCAGKLLWKKEHIDHNCEPDRQICSQCGHVLYENSAPTASAFIMNKKNEVLLAKRSGPPRVRYWDALGGFLEAGEDPVTGVKRELKEEVNVTLKDLELFGFYMDTYLHQGHRMHTLNIYYTAQISKGTPRPSDDVADAKWFALHKLPTKIAFPSVERALKDLIKKYK